MFKRKLPSSGSQSVVDLGNRWLPDSASRGVAALRLAESRSHYDESGSRYSNFFKFIIDLQNFIGDENGIFTEVK